MFVGSDTRHCQCLATNLPVLRGSASWYCCKARVDVKAPEGTSVISGDGNMSILLVLKPDEIRPSFWINQTDIEWAPFTLVSVHWKNKFTPLWCRSVLIKDSIFVVNSYHEKVEQLFSFENQSV